MHLNLEELMTDDILIEGISGTLASALHNPDKYDEDHQLLIYTCNYVKTKGALVTAKDLQTKFEQPILNDITHCLIECYEKRTYSIAGAITAYVVTFPVSLYYSIAHFGTAVAIPTILLLTGAGFFIMNWAKTQIRALSKEFYDTQLEIEKTYKTITQERFEKLFTTALEQHLPTLKEQKYL